MQDKETKVNTSTDAEVSEQARHHQEKNSIDIWHQQGPMEATQDVHRDRGVLLATASSCLSIDVG